ncbi:unnamed protein product [Prorocentrum cordatum]|uniref:Uncharacterized protein n=1 Tax=Prorocentrum cordatum TaxID=2364126 RepID=A0ABN9RYH7_9DINO|nr:unnamed protein product [Polarella glacialis]
MAYAAAAEAATDPLHLQMLGPDGQVLADFAMFDRDLRDFWKLFFSGLAYIVRLVNTHVIVGIMTLYMAISFMLKNDTRNVGELFERSKGACSMFMCARGSASVLTAAVTTLSFQAGSRQQAASGAGVAVLRREAPEARPVPPASRGTLPCDEAPGKLTKSALKTSKERLKRFTSFTIFRTYSQGVDQLTGEWTDQCTRRNNFFERRHGWNGETVVFFSLRWGVWAASLWTRRVDEVVYGTLQDRMAPAKESWRKLFEWKFTHWSAPGVCRCIVPVGIVLKWRSRLCPLPRTTFGDSALGGKLAAAVLLGHGGLFALRLLLVPRIYTIAACMVYAMVYAVGLGVAVWIAAVKVLCLKSFAYELDHFLGDPDVLHGVALVMGIAAIGLGKRLPQMLAAVSATTLGLYVGLVVQNRQQFSEPVFGTVEIPEGAFGFIVPDVHGDKRISVAPLAFAVGSQEEVARITPATRSGLVRFDVGRRCEDFSTV